MRDQGDQGERGDKGQSGGRGERGPKGDHGQAGDTGERGMQGETQIGDRGPTGDHGQPGQRGERGERGQASHLALIGYVLLSAGIILALWLSHKNVREIEKNGDQACHWAQENREVLREILRTNPPARFRDLKKVVLPIECP